MNLETHTNEIKNRETAAFNYKGKVAIRAHSKEPCFSGCMDLLTTAKIELGYNPKYTEECKKLETIVEQPFEEAFSSLTRHELNHKGGGKFKGCPRNIDLHAERILEPVSETLSQLCFQNVPVTEDQCLYDYFANMIEDIFNNAELGTKTDHTGMFLLYKDDAEHLENKKFTPLFDAFVELQERLYSGKRAKKLIKLHHSGAQKVKEAVDNFMEKSGLNNFKTTVFTRRKKKEVEIVDRKKAINYCIDENNWATLSKIMTEEFAKLLDKNKMTQPAYIKKMFLPLKGESDSFKNEMNDPEIKMKFAFKKYQQPGNSFEPPKYINNFEALDLIYQRLARNLEIKTNISTRSETMPVMWYGKRPFDAAKDRLSKARIEINNNGTLELRIKKYHEDDNIEYTESKSNIPNIRLIKRDDSGSMKQAIEGSDVGKIMNPWAPESQQFGDKSRYHQLLVGEWTLYEYLKKQGALKHTSIKSASYSRKTRTATNLAESKKQALNPSFGNATILDMEQLNNLFNRDELVISISDGQIDNWNDRLVEPQKNKNDNTIKEGIKVKDDYIKKAKQNKYFHLQIGGPTQMSQDLETAGLPVIYDNGKNIGKIIVDLTRPYVTRSKK